MKAPSTLFLSALGLGSIILACGPRMPQPGVPAHGPAVPPQLASHGAVIPLDGGERRTRRFPGASSEFTIKIDSANGGAPDLVMGYEELAPGAVIPPHRHLMSDEILFVHHGIGIATLGEMDTPVRTGATVYIPRNTRISFRNTGPDSLGLVFIFSHPGFEQYLRATSTPTGTKVVPMTAEELARVRRANQWHTEYDRP